MSKTRSILLIIISVFLVSCATVETGDEIELVLIEFDSDTNQAELELRNNSSSKIEYVADYFVSKPVRSQKPLPDYLAPAENNWKLLEPGDSVQLTRREVVNPFYIAVYVRNAGEVEKKLIWTHSPVNIEP